MLLYLKLIRTFLRIHPCFPILSILAYTQLQCTVYIGVTLQDGPQ